MKRNADIGLFTNPSILPAANFEASRHADAGNLKGA